MSPVVSPLAAEINRRDFLWLLGGTAAAISLIGCGAPGSNGGNGPNEWVIAAAEDPTVYSNPLMPGGGVGAVRVQSHVFDSLLFAQGPNLDLTHFLAKGYDVVSPTLIRLHLRDGVKFHNGDTVTADDVKYNLDVGLNDSKLTQSYYIGAIKQVNVVDPLTVELVLKQPFSPLFYNMSFGITGIVSKKAREAGIDQFNKKPIGAGPYQVVGEWASGKPITLQAFDGYWAGKVSPNKMTIKLIQDASTRTAELLSGRAHIIENVSIADIPQIEKSGKARVQSAKASDGKGRNIQYTMNPARPFFADVRVRQALNYAVDRKSIVKNVLEGHGDVMAGIMPKGWLGYDPSIEPWPFDPSKAKSLLQAAGFGSGFSFTWEITDGVFLRDREIAEAIAPMLKDVGVTANLRITERAVQFNHFYSGNWDLNTLQWPVMKDPDGNLAWNLETSAPMAAYKPYDPLRAMQFQAQATYDLAERTKIYQQLNRQMWDMCPWLYVHVQDEIWASSNQIDWQPVPFEGQATEFWYLSPHPFQDELKAKNA